MENHLALIQQLQADLEAIASPKTKNWWENYMRHVIPFRGVGIPQIRERLEAWRAITGVADWSKADQLELALAFFACPIAEDKLAGTLFLQNYLYDQFPWQELLPRYAALFEAEQIFDWNICDWFCVRVLGPTIALHGLDCAQAIAAWHSADNLWQARASVVAFVPVTAETTYYTLIYTACATLIQREERFAKTAVGWILRDISKHDLPGMSAFVEQHLAHFSVEALKNASKYLDKTQQQQWVNHLNSGRKRLSR